MTILELNFEKGWRGGERQTIYSMEGFRNAGISTDLICRKGSALEIQAKKDGFITHGFKSIFGVIFFLIVKGKNYQFHHAQTSHILTYCVITKFFHRAKILFTRRVNFVPKGFFTKLKYSYTDKIIVISEAIKKTLIEFCGRKDIEIISDIIVQKTVDLHKVKTVIDSLNISEKYIIATTSSLTKEKDPFTMIEAIKKLSEKRNDFVFLHFGSGNLKDIILKKIKEADLEHTYFLMGFVENVDDYFSSFNIFVMTSKEEGLGSSVLDAFINKIPVVSTNAGGLKSLLKDEKGILCDIGNSDCIMQGIDAILNSEQQKDVFIKNAFSYVNQYHSMKYITDQYLEVIKKITTTN